MPNEAKKADDPGAEKEPAKAKIPEAPPMTPEAGDKTPAYVAWLKKYHPAQAAKQYANRRGKVLED